MPTASLFLLTAILGASPEVSAPSGDQIRDAVQRSIPFIEEKGVYWIEQKKCVTCHRVGNMVWSLGYARQRGFSVSNRLDEWVNWAISVSLKENDDGKIAGTTNMDGVAQLLLARNLIDIESEHADSFSKLTRVIVDGQQADGSWKPGGQLPFQKRPKSETTDVTTMWLALALESQVPSEDSRTAISNAMKKITSSPTGKSTEWYAVRLLLAQRLGDAKTASGIIENLRGQQRTDGGWSWLAGDASDALGTGIAVFALLRAGVDRNDAMVARANQFLIETQRDDGTWAVKGTKAKKKDRVEETAVYWGTTWAVLALVESLPQTR